jgi:hypothetical protein
MSARLLPFWISLLMSVQLSAQRISGSTPGNTQSSRYLSNIPEGTVFYEGFENAQRPSLPLGWISQSNASTGFITGTGGDAASQANENGFWPVPLHGIFAMSNDDVCNCDKSQDKLISPIINASGKDRLFLGFEAFQNGSGGQTASLEIKAQGLPWLNVLTIPSSSRWEHYEVTIPQDYLTKAFQFRFLYSDGGNYASGLAIDDILLSTRTAEAIGIVTAQLIADDDGLGTAQIQNQIPLSQARSTSWKPAAIVRNQGEQVKNAQLESRLLGPVNAIVNATNWRIEAGEQSMVRSALSESLTPHATGSYTVEVELQTDSTDQITSDDLQRYSFNVVDSIYSWVPFSNNYNLGAWIQSTGDRFGSGFQFYRSDSLIALHLNVHPSSESGARFRVKIFSYDTLASSLFSSPVFELQEDDIGAVMRIPIDTRVSKGRKLVVIEKESGSERLVLALSSARSAQFENSLTKKAVGDWTASAYFPQMQLITLPPTFPCDAYILNTITHPSCAGLDDGSIDLDVRSNNGNLSYAWSNGAGNVDQINGLESGNYRVTVTDANGCNYSSSFTIVAPDTLTAVPSIVADSCAQGNGEVSLQPIGGNQPYTVLWSGDTTGATIKGLPRGTYPVQITDLNGCAWNDTIRVPGTEQLGVLFNTTSPNCGDTNGSVATVAVGTTPLQFSWSNGAAGPTLNNVTAGIYTLTLTDSIGCHIEREVAVNDLNAPTIAVNAITDVVCEGTATGAIALSVGGGTLPYSYNWSNGRTSEDLDSLNVGKYVLSLTDQQGCQSFGIYNVNTDANPIIIDFNDRGNYCWKDSNARVEVIVSGGLPPYNYNWSNGGSEAMIDDLGTGNYTVTISDLDGCTKVRSIEVAEGPPFFVQLDSLQEDTSTSLLINGSIWMSTYGGTPPYSHTWNDSITMEDLPNIPNGDYALIARDQLGCAVFFTVELGKGPVGSEEAELAHRTTVYPNPVRSSAHVFIQSDQAYNVYQWQDLQGRILRQGSLEAGNGLPAPAVQPGVFILRLRTESGLVKAIQMVVTP